MLSGRGSPAAILTISCDQVRPQIGHFNAGDAQLAWSTSADWTPSRSTGSGDGRRPAVRAPDPAAATIPGVGETQPR